ncbi:carboxymuconolactone decarboxylase family protein [Streptomyces mobaraensis]|nr:MULTISPECIES: carboxymuconolactone decarboxylase family protein [Streptomyces]UBI40984.1 carboxymuconolactone decarboxylase family protein [Streptomyces mobaraensis]UKW33464.1 carboxymuconolactone decarboxylase family protein [Streptomyces sp. TYQ1024]
MSVVSAQSSAARPGAATSAAEAARADVPASGVPLGAAPDGAVHPGAGGPAGERVREYVPPTTDTSTASAPGSAVRPGAGAPAAEQARVDVPTAGTSSATTATDRPSTRRTAGRTGIGVGVGRQAAFGARGPEAGAGAPGGDGRPTGAETRSHTGTGPDTSTGVGNSPSSDAPAEVARREDVRPAGSATLPAAATTHGTEAAVSTGVPTDVPTDTRAPRARHRAGGAYSADALTVVEPGADAGGAGAPAGALDVRRRALGEAHGEAYGQAAGAADPFTREFEDFAARVTWDESWSRAGLDPRTRALLTLTALTAGGHVQELPGHARAALRLGVTPGEIQEALRHTALYAGLPAARAAFAAIRPVMGDGPGRPDSSPEGGASS